MVSAIGWLVGLSATCVIISGCFFGLLSFYHAKKLKAKLLTFAGLMIFFVGLLYLGPLVEFISVLFLGKNLEPNYLISLLSYTWVAPGLFFAIYIGAELLMPKRKKVIIIIYVILGVIFELFLWLDTVNSFTFNLGTPGEDLIDASYNRNHPTFILIAIFLVSVLIFDGIGFLIKAYQSTGELRKKFLFLSTANIIFVVSGVFDSLVAPGFWLFFARLGMIIYAWFMYIGLKT